MTGPRQSRSGRAGRIYDHGVTMGRRVALLLVALAMLVAVIGIALRTSAPPNIDTGVHRWMVEHRHRWVTDIAITATVVGSSPVIYPLFAVAAVVVFRRGGSRRRWLRPLIAFGVLASGTVLRTGLSDLLMRARPAKAEWAYSAGGYSLPSGHTTNSALAAGMVVWLIWPRLHTNIFRISCLALALGFAGAVGWSRIYLGVHWPTDVVAGWLLAGCWISAAILVVGLIRPEQRWQRPRPTIGSAVADRRGGYE